MQFSRMPLWAAAALALGACASTGGGAGGERTTYLTYNDCFYARSMTDWRPLDDMNLVVFTGVRRPYHVQLTMRSTSLRYQDAIAFTDRDGRICPFGGDALIVNGALQDRIPIASIRRLTESELEGLYRSFGIRTPEVVESPVTDEAAQ